VPRVRDTVTGKEIQLDTYKSLQKRHYGDKKLMKRCKVAGNIDPLFAANFDPLQAPHFY